MITRTASRSHICLSCRRSLAKHKFQPASQIARQSTDSRLQHIAKQVSTDQPQDDPTPFNNGNIVRRAFGRGHKVSSYPLGRLHGHRGIKLRENLEKLSTTSLGEAANVIVLRDSGYSVYEHGKESLEPQEAEHIDILGQLEDERGLVGQEEVNENINACRPREGEKPRGWDGINTLVRQLQDGFATSQLERYIERFEGKREPESPPAEWVTQKEKAPIIRITPWQPGVSDIVDYFDNDPLRGYFLESHTAKQRVILRLLRECWMLELPELEEGIGQFEIQVQSDDLALLLMGPLSMLDTIRAEYLELDGESLEAFPRRSVIRITTSHSKKNLIVQTVAKALKGVERRQLALYDLFLQPMEKGYLKKLQRWAQSTFDDAALQELSQLTTTSIARRPHHKLLISSITKPSALFSSNDVATRLLLTAANFSDRVRYQLACHPSNATHGAMISHHSVEGLPWRERLRNWTRWTFPTGKENGNTKKFDPKQPPKVLLGTTAQPQKTSARVKRPKSTLKKTPAAKKSETDDGLVYWSPALFTQTSVLMGNVIHSSLDPAMSVSPKTLTSKWIVHSFSTHLPNLSRVLSKFCQKQDNEILQQLVLHFQPNPFYVKPDTSTQGIGAAVLSAFPPIEMIFDIADDEFKTAKLKHVHAVVDESNADVMLPGNAVDLRFHQRKISSLRKRYIDPIQEFLKKSQLALAGAGVLETPPSITLPISRHICHEPGFKLLNRKTWKMNKREREKDHHEVEYLFTGLQVRQTIIFEIQGWRLLYTSIEAGKAGGRRGELRLRPSMDGKVMTEEELREMAYKLAHMLGDTGTEDHVLKETRRVPILDEKDRLVRRFVTKEAKANTTFKYFGKRPLDEMEEETSRVKGKNKDFRKNQKEVKTTEAAKLGDVVKSADFDDGKDNS